MILALGEWICSLFALVWRKKWCEGYETEVDNLLFITIKLDRTLKSIASLTSDSAFSLLLLCRRCSLYPFAIINFLTGSKMSWLERSALYLVFLPSCQPSSQNCMQLELNIWQPHLLCPQTSRFSSFRIWFSQILFICVDSSKVGDGFSPFFLYFTKFVFWFFPLVLFRYSAQVKKWDFSFTSIWNTVVWLMIMKFFTTIVTSTAQRYLKKEQEKEIASKHPNESEHLSQWTFQASLSPLFVANVGTLSLSGVPLDFQGLCIGWLAVDGSFVPL